MKRTVKAWVCPAGSSRDPSPTVGTVTSRFHGGCDEQVYLAFPTRASARRFYGSQSGEVRATITFDDGAPSRKPARAAKGKR